MLLCVIVTNSLLLPGPLWSILVQLVSWHLESNNLISTLQCGFRSKRKSTIDYLIRLETNIREAFIKNEHLIAIFFDLEKADDTTWKYGVMKDLHDLVIKGRLPQFIDGFLSKREFRVRVNSSLSDEKNQEESIPQGSILSVTLFNIKINNVIKELSSRIDGSLICFKSKYIHTIERKRQQGIKKISKCGAVNRFKFSKTKTKCVHFCHKK